MTAPKNALSKVQKLQNSEAKIILLEQRLASTVDMHQRLNWCFWKTGVLFSHGKGLRYHICTTWRYRIMEDLRKRGLFDVALYGEWNVVSFAGLNRS